MANSESGQPLAVVPQAYGALWRGLLGPLRTIIQRPPLLFWLSHAARRSLPSTVTKHAP